MRYKRRQEEETQIINITSITYLLYSQVYLRGYYVGFSLSVLLCYLKLLCISLYF